MQFFSQSEHRCLTSPPSVRFRFKEYNHPPSALPPPPLPPPPPHTHTQLTLYLKKSEKHMDLKRKYKKEMEEVHDNAKAFLRLNIKTNK